MPRSSNATRALSPQAETVVKTLGENIRRARVRRNIIRKDLAQRIQVSPVTLGKLENGDPTVGINVLLMALDVLGLVDDMLLVADPDTDNVGKSLEASRVPQKATRKQKKNLDF